MKEKLKSKYIGIRLTEEEYLGAKLDCHGKRQVVEKVFSDRKLDVMVFPGVMDLPAITGFPGICVPAGYRDDGRPFGITFMALEGEEGKILSAAYAYEQATGLRREPEFL